jgi:hypothetical protein
LKSNGGIVFNHEVVSFLTGTVTIRNARAAVLLRFRGRRLPTLAELRKLTKSKTK